MVEGQTWGAWTGTGLRRTGGTAEVLQAQRGGERGAIKWARDAAHCARQLERERDALLEIAAGDPRARDWVVTVLDHGTRDGRPWIALPWFEHTLRTYAALEPGLPALLRACASATLALHRLHESTAVLGSPRLHRDVKPDNFLVGHDVVVLADLGTARSGSMVDVVTPTVVYTPRYAPVEQTLSLSRPPDPSVDAHALAVTIYTSLAGQEPDSKGAFVPYTPLGARLLDAQGRRQPPDDLDDLRRRPLAELVRLDEMSALESTDEHRLVHRFVDEHGPDAGAAAAAALLPALRGALEPDPSRRSGDLRRLAAALDAATRSLGATPAEGAVAPARPVSASPTTPPPAMPVVSPPHPAPPPPPAAPASPPTPAALPDRPDEDDPVARYTLVIIGLSLLALIVVLALASP